MPKLLGKLNLVFFFYFSLIFFILIAFLLFIHPDIFAQVTSGDIRILDTVIDLGGGSRESGTGADRVILKNTSIGQPTAGAYVVNNQLVVGGGHAYKADYCYDCIKISSLIVRADTNSGATDKTGYDYTRRLSGLKSSSDDPNITSEENGQKYYNNLLVQPILRGDVNKIELSGALFTSKNYRPSNQIPPQDQFTYMLGYVSTSKGFLVVYANKDFDHTYGPPKNISTCGKSFCQFNYYVYGADGRWRIINSTSRATVTITNKQVMRISVHPLDSDPPLKPAFSVELLAPLIDGTSGSIEWDTYGFLASTEALAGEIAKTETSESAPVGVGSLGASSVSLGVTSVPSSFYLFDL